VDASNTHIGSCLQQQRQGSRYRESLRVFSKKLENVQSNYSAFIHELLDCVASIRHFRFMQEGELSLFLRITSC
jgi:hypothetical protein